MAPRNLAKKLDNNSFLLLCSVNVRPMWTYSPVVFTCLLLLCTVLNAKQRKAIQKSRMPYQVASVVTTDLVINFEVYVSL